MWGGSCGIWWVIRIATNATKKDETNVYTRCFPQIDTFVRIIFILEKCNDVLLLAIFSILYIKYSLDRETLYDIKNFSYKMHTTRVDMNINYLWE